MKCVGPSAPLQQDLPRQYLGWIKPCKTATKKKMEFPKPVLSKSSGEGTKWGLITAWINSHPLKSHHHHHHLTPQVLILNFPVLPYILWNLHHLGKSCCASSTQFSSVFSLFFWLSQHGQCDWQCSEGCDNRRLKGSNHLSRETTNTENKGPCLPGWGRSRLVLLILDVLAMVSTGYWFMISVLCPPARWQGPPQQLLTLRSLSCLPPLHSAATSR